MPVSPDSRRRNRWWLPFALLVALPAVALAVGGLGAISAERIDEEARRRRQAAFAAQLADTAIAAAIERALVVDTAAASPGLIRFERDERGVVSFPSERVYVAGFGFLPASLASRLRIGVESDGVPREIVAAIVAGTTARTGATASRALIENTLAHLRAGTWWLHLDQRRVYDAELSRLLERGGARGDTPDDIVLDVLARTHVLVTTELTGRATTGSAGLQMDNGTGLIAWSRDARTSVINGVVIDPPRAQTLVSGAVEGAATSQGFAAAVRDRRGGVVWGPAPAIVELLSDSPLAAVDGWSLRLWSREAPGPRIRWRAYGLVGLPLVVLAFGLVTMTRVMGREMDLVRRQAEFTAAVTHEFKSPLTSLRLVMERIAAGRLENSGALREYHQAIERETDRLDTLVTRLLDAQALQQGRGGDMRVSTPIGPLLHGAIDQLRRQAEARQITIGLTVDPQMPDLRVDRVRVTDAVLNLVENAIKYSPTGSRVEVDARATDGEVCITVSDHGVGIHEADVPRIFEPYYRGRLGDRESVRGTGLGLALVQAAAFAHGGRVDVQTEPGKGSQFTFRLPVEERP